MYTHIFFLVCFEFPSGSDCLIYVITHEDRRMLYDYSVLKIMGRVGWRGSLSRLESVLLLQKQELHVLYCLV